MASSLTLATELVWTLLVSDVRGGGVLAALMAWLANGVGACREP